MEIERFCKSSFEKSIRIFGDATHLASDIYD